MAAHESPRTTKLYDPTDDEITLDEVDLNLMRRPKLTSSSAELDHLRPAQIYVSYSPIDDKQGRVTSLVRALEREIPLHELRFWMPRHALMDWDGLLLDQIRQSAMLLLCLSRAYLEADWCQKEYKEFLATHGERANRELIVIELDDVDHAQIPEPINKFILYRFWKYDTEGQLRRICWPRARSVDHEYLRLVADLITNWYELRVREQSDTQPVTPRIDSSSPDYAERPSNPEKPSSGAVGGRTHVEYLAVTSEQSTGCGF
jgi:hypothetical protein